MNKVKVILACLSLCVIGCADSLTELEALPTEGAKDREIKMEWDRTTDSELNQLTVFLFNKGESQPFITRFFDENELQVGMVDFSLPVDYTSAEYEIFGIANLDCRHIKERYDLYRLQENKLIRYHSDHYATAIAKKQPDGGFLYTCNEQVKFSDKPLRLTLERTVARLEITVEMMPGMEETLGATLQVDSFCVEGLTTRMFLFDKPSGGWRDGFLNQQADKHCKGLFYLYPSLPGEPLPRVKLWCSYEIGLAGMGIYQKICYPLTLDGSMTESGKKAILANKRYRLLVQVNGAGIGDLSLKLEIDDWTEQNQDQEF